MRNNTGAVQAAHLGAHVIVAMDLSVTPFTFVYSTIINQHPTAMNNGIIPVPDEVLKYRSPLFDLATPITLPAEEFDTS
jgi:hypothetical protein